MCPSQEDVLPEGQERRSEGAGEGPAGDEELVQASCYPSRQHGVEQGQPEDGGSLDRATPSAHVNGHANGQDMTSDSSAGGQEPVQASRCPSGQHGVEQGQFNGEGSLDRAPPSNPVDGHADGQAVTSDSSGADAGVEDQKEESASQANTACDGQPEDEMIDSREPDTAWSLCSGATELEVPQPQPPASLEPVLREPCESVPERSCFRHILQFVPTDEYLFVAPVCRVTKEEWTTSGRACTTSVRRMLSTHSRAREHLDHLKPRGDLDHVDLGQQQLAFENAMIRCGGIFALTARQGNFDGLKDAVKIYGEHWNHWKSSDEGSGVTGGAAMCGSLEILRWARDTEACTWDPDTFSFAAANGNMEILEWLHVNGCPWASGTCAAAARAGRQNVLEWLRERGCPWDETTCAAAARGGHLEVLKWAWAEGCEWDDKGICAAAAENGHTDVLKWARSVGFPWDADTCRLAALGGHLDTLLFARRGKCPCSEHNCMMAAAEGGHLDVMEEFDEAVNRSTEFCRGAALGGHVTALKWLREKAPNGQHTWNHETCAYAAAHGRLAILKWARASGCGWNAATCCANAAKNGHLDVLEWVKSQEGSRWKGGDMCYYAAVGGNVGVMKYVRSQGCPWDAKLRTCEVAAKNGHLELLQWCRANGCPWQADKMCKYAANQYEVLRWVKKQGCT